MELFHADVSAADLVSGPGPLVVGHEATGLAAVLAEGQEVLVTDRDGELPAAVVLPENEGLHEIVDLLGDLRRAQSFTRQP